MKTVRDHPCPAACSPRDPQCAGGRPWHSDTVCSETTEGNQWPVMWHQSPNQCKITQKRMATKTAVRFWKDDVIFTCHSDFQTPAQASIRAVIKICLRLLVLELRVFKDTLVMQVLWAPGECNAQVCADPHRKLNSPAGTDRFLRMQGDSWLPSHLIYPSPVLCPALLQFGGICYWLYANPEEVNNLRCRQTPS